jgi:hypothetical protein
LKSGHFDAAIHLFEQQAAFAEVADIDRQTSSKEALFHSPYKISLTAYNNLALAHLEKHDYFWARAWALVALMWDKDNSAAQFNLRKIEQALAQWQWPKTMAGEYVRYAGRGTWQSIVIKPSAPDSVQFCFSGLWWGLGKGPSGLGDLRATVPFHKDVAEYSTHEFSENECHISMRFYADRLEAKQTGDDSDCGFGHNVAVEGTFQRISSSAECPPEEK